MLIESQLWRLQCDHPGCDCADTVELMPGTNTQTAWRHFKVEESAYLSDGSSIFVTLRRFDLCARHADELADLIADKMPAGED